MGLTPIYGFPYPGVSDSPNGPVQVQDLAEAVEAQLAVTDAAVAALNVQVPEATSYATSTQNTAGTTTSGAFTATLTGGTACSLTFVAPASGKVDIYNTSQTTNSGAATSICSFALREGGVVGSGTVVLAAGIPHAVYSTGTGATRATVLTEITGLTPGATYNVRQEFAVTGNTGSFENKRLHVRPAA